MDGLETCPACLGGWHGEHCLREYWTIAEPPELVSCSCTAGACAELVR